MAYEINRARIGKRGTPIMSWGMGARITWPLFNPTISPRLTIRRGFFSLAHMTKMRSTSALGA